jgi:hypothetical protein
VLSLPTHFVEMMKFNEVTRASPALTMLRDRRDLRSISHSRGHGSDYPLSAPSYIRQQQLMKARYNQDTFQISHC